jgi:hypothetical protein
MNFQSHADQADGLTLRFATYTPGLNVKKYKI